VHYRAEQKERLKKVVQRKERNATIPSEHNQRTANTARQHARYNNDSGAYYIRVVPPSFVVQFSSWSLPVSIIFHRGKDKREHFLTDRDPQHKQQQMDVVVTPDKVTHSTISVLTNRRRPHCLRSCGPSSSFGLEALSSLSSGLSGPVNGISCILVVLCAALLLSSGSLSYKAPQHPFRWSPARTLPAFFLPIQSIHTEPEKAFSWHQKPDAFELYTVTALSPPTWPPCIASSEGICGYEQGYGERPGRVGVIVPGISSLQWFFSLFSFRNDSIFRSYPTTKHSFPGDLYISNWQQVDVVETPNANGWR
jgi:hypothetical protein